MPTSYLNQMRVAIETTKALDMARIYGQTTLDQKVKEIEATVLKPMKEADRKAYDWLLLQIDTYYRR